MDNVTKEVWVFVEQHDGKAADVSLELLSKGRKLADRLSGVLKAVVLGCNVRNIAEETFKYGADSAILIDHPALEKYRPLPYSRMLNKLVNESKPRIVLFGATVVGRGLAPRVASNTVSGLTADCTELQIEDVTYLKKDYKDLLLQIRPAFGGNIIATIITPDNPVQMATVREGVMEMHEVETPNSINIETVDYIEDTTDDLVKIIEQYREESKVNLKGAPIIVAGGYGLGTKENFKLIHNLADAVGGEVAGSRAAVDAGFVDHDRQVGQTGITVRPKLIFSIGISGAIQHRAGMQEANKIIAINTDPDAPIFDIAHYGIVGKAEEVIPNFIDLYKHKLK
ncbi:MAG: electron transfer flavoprotein subunit alpha/FixB family protein [Melioribacteraceae bacterium]|nr:electron transfer flavoprotein subunit alpha/FixB family protein [Melioribacteraceae bacterium]